MAGSEREITSTMWAARLRGAGGPSDLDVEQVPTPQPAAGEALVRVHAAALTRDELDWPTDRLPAIPSYELSGVVAGLGPDVDGVAVGDPVWALTAFDRDGAAAEFCVVPAELLAPKPTTLDHEQSAALPMPGLTAWQALFDHGGLAEGERVLVLGAAGGVGYVGAQLARRAGASVIGTASASSVELARGSGAHEVIDHADVHAGGVDPVDLVFDTVGGELLARSVDVIRPGGRLVSVAEEPPDIPADRTIEATYFIVEPNRDQLVELGRIADAGELRPAIDSVYPLADARAAFERSMAPGKRGKVVIRVTDDVDA